MKRLYTSLILFTVLFVAGCGFFNNPITSDLSSSHIAAISTVSKAKSISFKVVLPPPKTFPFGHLQQLLQQ